MSLKQELSLRDHQESAGEATLKRDGNIIFSHPVGSGKTLSSISAFEKLREVGKANRALIVTPASLRTNYGENGVKRFTNSNYRVYGNKQEIESDKTGIFSEPNKDGPEYGIVSYELFRENPGKYIKGHNADTVVFDEIHRIKNDESKTFKALKDSRKTFRNFIGMTGSISSNSPSDVIPLIDAMTNGNHRLGTKTSFENRFVSVDKDGNKTLTNKILVRSLIAPYVHHVTEEQVNENVGLRPPKKEINEIEVPFSDEHSEYYRYVIDQLDPVTKLKLSHGLGKVGKAQMDAIFAKLLKARQVANSISMINPSISLAESAQRSSKVKKMLDDVEDHLKNTSDAQVVIHSELLQGGMDVIEAGLQSRGIDYGKFIGKGNAGVTEKARQQDVTDYNSGKKKVILLSSAGGEGLDLPNTTLVASLDGHWNPEKVNQVEARGVRMGGLSHRPEGERKVIINRYISRLPLAKLDVAKNVWHNVSPERIVGRLWNGEPAFFNPVKSIPTVDRMMYNVAKQKAKGNEELKGMFDKTASQKILGRLIEKTAEFSINSDKQVLNEYMSRFGDDLLTGDYQGKWIDEAQENKYLNKLRKYYALAKSRDVIKVEPKLYEEYKDRTPMSHALKTYGTSAAIQVPLLTGLSAAGMLGGRGLPWQLKAGVGAVGGLVGAGVHTYQTMKPHVTTSKPEAKKLLNLNDEELLRVLRGEAVTKEEIKKKDLFIRVK